MHVSLSEVTHICRDREFPEQYSKEIDAALGKVGLSLSNLKKVDNSCKPHPKESLLDQFKGALKDINPPIEDTAPPPLDKIREGPPEVEQPESELVEKL